MSRRALRETMLQVTHMLAGCCTVTTTPCVRLEAANKVPMHHLHTTGYLGHRSGKQFSIFASGHPACHSLACWQSGAQIITGHVELGEEGLLSFLVLGLVNCRTCRTILLILMSHQLGSVGVSKTLQLFQVIMISLFSFILSSHVFLCS